jgi:hypothetical protein
VADYCRLGYVTLTPAMREHEPLAGFEGITPSLSQRLRNFLSASGDDAVEVYIRDSYGHENLEGHVSQTNIGNLSPFGKVELHEDCFHCHRIECVERGLCDRCSKPRCLHAKAGERVTAHARA